MANSQFIASRIRKYYGCESAVIHPPVESALGHTRTVPGDYYLCVGRLVDYKRFELAVHACSELGRPLRVIGDGPQHKLLRKVAGPTVEFLGRVDDRELREHLAGCRALLFPGRKISVLFQSKLRASEDLSLHTRPVVCWKRCAGPSRRSRCR